MSIICPNCGTELPDDSLFCLRCGVRFMSASDTVARPETQQPVYQPPQTEYQQYQAPPLQYPPAAPAESYSAYYYPPVYVKPSLKGAPGRGFGITSMVLGIISAVYSSFTFLWVMLFSMAARLAAAPDYVSYIVRSFITIYIFGIGAVGILALIFALISRSRGYKHQSTAGLILSACSLAALLISLVIVLAATAH